MQIIKAHAFSTWVVAAVCLVNNYILLQTRSAQTDNEAETKAATIQQIVNVNKDLEILQFMESWWKQQQQRLLQNGSNEDNSRNLNSGNAMLFVQTDFACETLEKCCSHFENDSAGDPYFDLVTNKSTLDCLLCTDKAAAGLLMEIYCVLRPEISVYLVISFHSIDLLQPLLVNLSGTDWEVTCSTMYQQIEDLAPPYYQHPNEVSSHMVASTIICAPTSVDDDSTAMPPSSSTIKRSTTEAADAWSSRNFEPNELYRRTVNVIMCHHWGRRMISSTEQQKLDWGAVYQHIHDANNQWYAQQNPMLSEQWTLQIRAAFDDNGNEPVMMKLWDCYQVLFSDAEWEHLKYKGFLGDWEAFCQQNPNLLVNQMSYAMAISFLEYAQWNGGGVF